MLGMSLNCHNLVSDILNDPRNKDEPTSETEHRLIETADDSCDSRICKYTGAFGSQFYHPKFCLCWTKRMKKTINFTMA